MQILVIYYHRASYPLRKTNEERIYAFKGHGETLFLNAAFKVPAFLSRITFDLIVFDASFLAQMRWSHKSYDLWVKPFIPLCHLKGKKVLLPQDEFLRSDDTNRFIEMFDIEVIFTVAPKSEWSKIYGTIAKGKAALYPVLTGYLSADIEQKIETLAATMPPRDIDISYRAWRAEPWLGSHGILKTEIADRVVAAAETRPLTIDISTAPSKTFLGDDWYRFLLRSKYTLGVEGGSSILDRDGRLRTRVTNYMEAHPTATFEEVEADCFPGRDGELSLFALSPRHLEACATRTCQILIEGSYNGILEAGIHYIALKRDFSNLDEVLDIVQEDRLRKEITDRAWEEIITSKLYTYDCCVKLIVSKSGVETRRLRKRERFSFSLQKLRERCLWGWISVEAFFWKRIKEWFPLSFINRLRALKGR